MKLKIIFGAIVLILISTLNTFAVDLGDPGDDPCDIGGFQDVNCPLDTWVNMLFIAVCIFAAYHLYRRAKSASLGAR
ncbi:hypothetical protein ACPPVU_22585 [Mucilaginibacter sp. McL0603]|uniref:hypothetical protein n=1 Tax=Mucilaginibacter sp. McL0603 TaxID=3415670 RepID=UPI003CE72E35